MNASRIHQGLIAIQALVFGVPIFLLALLGSLSSLMFCTDVPWIAATMSAIGCSSVLALVAVGYLVAKYFAHGPQALRKASAIAWVLSAMGCAISLSALASFYLPENFLYYSGLWRFQVEFSPFGFGSPLVILVLHLAGVAWWTHDQHE